MATAAHARAADWPTLNHDNARSGTTAEAIAAPQLREVWKWRSATLPQSAWPSPAKWDAFNNIPELPSMRNYDPVFHPAIAGQSLYFCSSADDTVRCLDARTGQTRWTFTADGPVRIAPSVSEGRVYFSSDDGAAYCVTAESGKLVWRFNPRKPDRLILNDGRLISPLPIRTGILVDGGTAYFAAGLLPWDPAVLCALDAATGKPEGPGRYVREFPTNTTFEGPLVCSQSKLIAPQGRVPPLLFDRATGELLGPLDGAGGGCFVLLTPQDQVISGPGNRQGQLVATRVNDRSRAAVIPQGRSMAVAADTACVIKSQSVHAMDSQFKAQRWQMPGQYLSVIMAGDTVFLGGTDEVVAISEKDGKPLWRQSVDGKAYGLAVADGSLFVSTDAGMLYCFRPDPSVKPADAAAKKADKKPGDLERKLALASGPTVHYKDPTTAVVSWQTETDLPTALELTLQDETRRFGLAAPKRNHEVRLTDLKRNRIYRYTIADATDPAKVGLSSTFELDTEFNFAQPRFQPGENPFAGDSQQSLMANAANHILAESGVKSGICLVIGTQKGQLPYELATRSQLRVIGLMTDDTAVKAARAALLPTGRYGSQITIHKVDRLDATLLPGLFANLIVSEQALTSDSAGSVASEVYRVLRPQGVALLGQAVEVPKKLSAAGWKAYWQTAGLKPDVSEGPAGTWTKVVRAPMPGAGEWTHEYGRADNSAYGGEQLGGSASSDEFLTQWVGRPGPGFQPDRNGRMPGPLAAGGRLFTQGLNRILAMDSFNGTILWTREVPGMIRMNVPRDSSNWCTDGEFVYLAVRGECWQMDARDGTIVRKFAALPGAKADWKYDWSYVGSNGPNVLGTSVKSGTAYTEFWGGGNWYDAPQGPETFKVCSDNLFALDKKSGEKKWQYTGGLIINPTITVGPRAIYLVECRHPKVLASETRRIGIPELWQQQFLVALDPATGNKQWERAIDTDDGITVFYQAYGDGKLVLVSSFPRAYHVYVFNADSGSPIWDHKFGWPGGAGDHGKAMSRPAIVGKKLFVRPVAFDLDNGKVLPQTIPGGGCGTYACTSSTLLFRSGHVTMWDAHSGDVSIWQRLRPGCWLSTIPADGLILSPEAGGGCSCGQWLETSIAFVPKSYYPRPRIVADGEVFVGSVDVALETNNKEGAIRYTLDGTDPTSASPTYEKPLHVDRAVMVKARYFHPDGNQGQVASRSFRPGFGDVVNLAPQATATATSEFNHQYLARFATDGAVIGKQRGADGNKAWAVFGPNAKGKAEFVLTWKEPVEVGEIVYYGRTAYSLDECFKDVEIFINNQPQPILKTKLEMLHGPQRIGIPPSKITVLRLNFTSSHGGNNPGAAEILVFSKTPADTLLPK